MFVPIGQGTKQIIWAEIGGKQHFKPSLGGPVIVGAFGGACDFAFCRPCVLIVPWLRNGVDYGFDKPPRRDYLFPFCHKITTKNKMSLQERFNVLAGSGAGLYRRWLWLTMPTAASTPIRLAQIRRHRHFVIPLVRLKG